MSAGKGGLHFLSTKSWHVLTGHNLEKVETAEAQQASLARRVETRRKLLERERRIQTHQALVSAATGGTSGNAAKGASHVEAKATSVAFLYEPPPGFVPAE